MNKIIQPSTWAKWLAPLALAIAFVSTAHANPNLTNGLIAYWPMDDTNGGSSTPDVENGYDLFPRSGANAVNFSNHIAVIPGVHSNALSFSASKSTLLAFISSANTAWGTPSTELPPSQYPSWTISFWINGATANNSGGGQRAVCLGYSGGSSPLWDFAAGGANSTTPQQIDQFIRMNGGNNGQGTVFINATGGTHRALNANWLDGTWHNITYIVNYITNYPASLIAPITAPSGGDLNFSFSSIPLDTLAANETNQVNTNQQYILQQATSLAAPLATRWLDAATVASAGYGSTSVGFDSATNDSAYYQVVGPAMRMQQWTIYMDGVLVGDSLTYNATNIDEPLGAPVPNNGTASVNYLQNWGNNPGGSDPDAIQPPLGVWQMDTIAFGGISRNGGTGSYFTGALDDVAVWKRAITPAEMTNYMSDGITNPIHAIPLQITLTEDFPAVAVGDNENLSWSGAKDGTQFTLNPGSIDENGNTVQGVGQDSQAVTANTTYTISETRGLFSVTSSQSVIAATGVNPGWHYIDSFTYLSANPSNGVAIAGQPSSASSIAQWVNPPAGYTLNMLPANVYSSSVDSNHYVSFFGQVTTGTAAGEGNGALAGRHLNGDSMPLGASNTLFFRFYIDPAVNNPDTNQSDQIPDVNCNVGLSDKGLRDIADFDGQNANNAGPAIYIVRATGGVGGKIDLQAADGSVGMALSPAGYSYIADTNNGDTNGLEVGKVYSVWIDVQNNDAEVQGGLQSGGLQTNGAYYTVWLQREDWAGRTNLFQDITATNSAAGVGYPTGVLVSDRDDTTADNVEGPTDQTINVLFMAASAAVAPTETNMLRFDDFYLSKSGFNSTVPITAGSLVK